MKRIHLPGLFDVIEIDKAVHITKLANDPEIDRAFSHHRLPFNAWMIGKILRVLSMNGQAFPTMRAKDAHGRAQQQEILWERLNSLAPAMRAGSQQLVPLARWVQGEGAADDLGQMLQQLVGELFNKNFCASTETWHAALVISGSLAPGNSLRKLWWRIGGELQRSKKILASLLNDDHAAVHGVAVAVHNMVRGIRDMRTLYADNAGQATPARCPVERVLKRCLHAPSVVFRQAKTTGNIDGCPYSPSTLLLLQLENAYQADNDASMVFLNQSWSRCPAEQWVPAVLEGVWLLANAKAESRTL